MPNRIAELDIEDAAGAAAGNWQKFQCFWWHRERELDSPERWFITYTHHRDSGLLDQSNAAAIEEALKPFTEGDDPDVVAEHHDHWVVGWINGHSIRVYDQNGQITDAFQRYHELAQRLADYPILNETDYSNREYEATVANLAEAAFRLKHEYDLPEGWQGEVYDWLSDYEPRAVENRDDQGGYLSEPQLKAAFDALGYEQTAAV